MLKVYTKPDCMYCVMTKSILEQYQIPFSIIDVSLQTESRNFLKSMGHTTVPQIYYRGRLFCDGYSGLADMTKQDIENLMKDES